MPDLTSNLVLSSHRSRRHPRRPSWETHGFQHGGRRMPDGRMWAVIAARDDEGPAADIAVDPFPISGVRRTGTRGVAAGEANLDRRGGATLLSWLTDPSVTEVVLDTSTGPLAAMRWPELSLLDVRLFVVLVDDPAVAVRRARHRGDDGGTVAVEELGWIACSSARSSDEIAEVLVDQDRIDAGRGAVFRIQLDDEGTG